MNNNILDEQDSLSKKTILYPLIIIGSVICLILGFLFFYMINTNETIQEPDHRSLVIPTNS